MVPARVALALQADGWYLRSEITLCKTAPMPESVTDRPTNATEKLYLLSKAPRYYFDQEAVRVPLVSGVQRYLGPARRKDYDASQAPGGGGLRDHARYDGQPQGNPAGRNLWNWLPWQPEALKDEHYAAFPRWLPRLAIRAGTSERGVCPACGAPWRRVTRVDYANPGNRTTNGPRSLANREMTAGFAVRLEKRVATTGWEPGCGCPDNDGSARAVIYDPFAGSGTTCLVALQEGRHFVASELSPKYVALANRRIARETGWHRKVALPLDGEAAGG
jgi:DNA modification methylase